MNKLSGIIAMVMAALILNSTTMAQFTIPRPKIPKISIEKPKPRTNSSQNTASAEDGPNGKSWFSAIAEFNQGYDPNWSISEPRAKYIVPYLQCYASKHGLELRNVDNGGVNRFNSENPYDIGEILKSELPKLAELERVFKSQFPDRPNTGKGYSENPAIWDEIFTDRESYYKCAVGELADPNDCDRMSTIDKARVAVHTDDMKELLDQVKTFTPSRGWYSGSFGRSYLSSAISPSQRKQFIQDMGRFSGCVSGLLDEIAANAKQTLPLYKMTGYNVRNPAEERMIRGNISDLDQATVFKVGLSLAIWTIQKSGLGIPEKRFKHGAIWLKYPISVTDDGFCRILYVNITQDYAGGGTYGQSYPYFVKSEPAGCPTGK